MLAVGECSLLTMDSFEFIIVGVEHRYIHKKLFKSQLINFNCSMSSILIILKGELVEFKS